MIPVAIVLVGGLVVLYLTRPWYRPVVVSAASLFARREANQSSRRFSLRSLATSKAFWLQLLVFVIVLLALILVEQAMAGTEVPQVGVWVVADTSASLTTRAGSADRAAQMADELQALVMQLAALPAEAGVCVRLYTLDLALNLVVRSGSPEQLSGWTIQPRLLGTDLSLIYQVFTQAEESLARAAEPGECQPTHIAVITDQPPQDAMIAEAPLPVIWRGVGTPTTNIGLIDVRPVSMAGFGQSPAVVIEVGAWGTADDAILSVETENGVVVATEHVVFGGRPNRDVTLELPGPGRYVAIIDPGDDYIYDDRVVFDWAGAQEVRVDWQVNDTQLAMALGWIVTADRPRLRVATWNGVAAADGVPTLYLGAGYNGALALIDRFIDAPDLLIDLDLDVAEEIGIRGVALTPESELNLVMEGSDGTAWFAWRSNPRAVLIPGLPETAGDAELQDFSTVAFFNAVRWLLMAVDTEPLFERTSPDQPEPDGVRNALHAGEGDTMVVASSNGDWSQIDATPAPRIDPVWPFLVAAAVLAFTVERVLALFRGAKWG